MICKHCGCETLLPKVFGQCPLCGRYMGGAPGCLVWLVILFILGALAKAF
jgi:hypothetical protein